jgi:endonuclease/exonuclease/phosphatase family metal-dependent hydrolase
MQKLLLLVTAILPMTFASAPVHLAPGNSQDSVRHGANAESHLLEIGHASKMRTVADSPAEVKVVSYNIRWRGGDELRQLAQLFKDDPEIGGAAILGLQEVDRNKQRTGNENTVKILAEELGMYYAWAAPGAPESKTRTTQVRGLRRPVKGDALAGAEEETGVAILSSYPLSHVQRIVLPHEGPGQRRRVALGATVTLGPTSLRVYSVHSETRISVERKLDQMKAVLDDLTRYRKGMPAVVLGDFNTWEQDAVAKTIKLFTAENFHTPFDEQATFFRRALFVSIDLKLDWIWLRNLEESGYGVNRRVELSDHWPLWIVLRTKASASRE